ncbi:MAG: MmgE/PrpD family protein [Chloroflexi bacterium]|nr:MmgE/PrpD family protein [Chloroflexota bacterium]
MDTAVAFAKNAVKTRYEDIPPKALRAARADVLDTLGTALVGSTASGGREIVALVKEWGGRKEATIIGSGGKVPAVSAALANGAMSDALDYDEAHENAHLHAGVSTIPVALALAERTGGVTGKEFLTAVCLGIDVICRMGLANPEGPAGFILTAVYGYFGSAITAGKLEDLTDMEELFQLLR